MYKHKRIIIFTLVIVFFAIGGLQGKQASGKRHYRKSVRHHIFASRRDIQHSRLRRHQQGKRLSDTGRYWRGYHQRYLIWIRKSDFMLRVYKRYGGVVARFRIAYGLNPDKKRKLWLGDYRSPEGLYHIKKIYSRFARHGTQSYKMWRMFDGLNLRARDGYYRYKHPTIDMGRHAYGPVIMMLNYPNKKDVKRHRAAVRQGRGPVQKNGKPRGPGIGIAIHGNNDRAMIGHTSSPGCFILYNRDIVRLSRYVRIGTRILITAK